MKSLILDLDLNLRSPESQEEFSSRRQSVRSMGNNLTRRPERIFDDGRGEGIGTVLINSGCKPSLICHCKLSRNDILKPIIWQHMDDNDSHPQPTRPEVFSDPSGGSPRKIIRSRQIASKDPFGILPEELLCTILSKLDLKEAAKTSILSSTWRHTWKHYPKLTFDILTMCGGKYKTREQRHIQTPECVDRVHYVQQFVNIVNTILYQHQGKTIERFELRLTVDVLAQLFDQLDDWVRYAVSSRTKNLILHVSLTPLDVFHYKRYVFPVQLLDAGSCLQHIQLAHVLLKVPSQFVGFPNLRRLGLYSTRVSASDMQCMVSNCPNIEWLDLFMVHLNDELKVDRPLSCLLYLRLSDCRVTTIELNAPKLQTFIFQGRLVPIHLGESSELHNIVIHSYTLTLEQAICSFADAYPLVQRLTLCHTCALPKFPWRLDNTSSFSHLRYLQLLLNIFSEHANDILSIAYFLEAAPFLQEFDLEFRSSCMDVVPGPLRIFPYGQDKYKYLTIFRVFEFRGEKSKVELIVHVVQNAPSLENLTIDPRRQHVLDDSPASEAEEKRLSEIRHIAKSLIGIKLSPKTKFNVV